jgi:hypothetical protein
MYSSSDKPLDKRRREARPERVTIGGELLVRNDIRARDLNMSERTINRGDAQGAPYLMIAGCKYRPVERHDAFILAGIQQHKPARRARAGRY